MSIPPALHKQRLRCKGWRQPARAGTCTLALRLRLLRLAVPRPGSPQTLATLGVTKLRFWAEHGGRSTDCHNRVIHFM